MNVFELIKLGQRYLKLWPEQPELSNYFAEYNIIKFSRLIYRYFPGLALFILIMQTYLGSLAMLPQAVMYSVFIISMPVQMLVILGVKADKILPPSLASWYKESVAKVNENGGSVKLSIHKPRYLDLASLLNLTYQKAKN